MSSLEGRRIMIKRFALGTIRNFARNSRASVAVEFAVIVPTMFTMYFGMQEFGSGIAVNRKVAVVARTMSDLVSQSTTVTDTDLANFTTTARAIMTPYAPGPLNTTVTELFIDPNTHTAKVKWSKGSAPRAVGATVSIPTALNIDGTYLIYSEVNYRYVPVVGYIMASAGITLSDFTYTRPRQSPCVFYPTAGSGC
jgi:Flp pilus assembly protein TadG